MNNMTNPCCEEQPVDYCRAVSMEVVGVTPNNPNKARDVRIEELDHGYMVKVGCKTFAFENLKKMLTILTNYLHNPNAMEIQYNNGTLNLD